MIDNNDDDDDDSNNDTTTNSNDDEEEDDDDDNSSSSNGSRCDNDDDDDCFSMALLRAKRDQLRGQNTNKNVKDIYQENVTSKQQICTYNPVQTSS